MVDHIKWISKVLTEALLAALPTSLHVEARLYITGPSAPSFEPREATFDRDITETSTPADPSSEKDVKLPLYHALQITHGRPSVKKIMQEEIARARGPISVDGKVCPSPYRQGYLPRSFCSRWPFWSITICGEGSGFRPH